MALELGKTYYLKNVAVNKYLNVYGNETISLGRNVNLYTKENCNAQKWIIDRKNSNDFGVYVMSKLNTGYTLNIYEEDSNNCTVYPYYYNGVYNVADAMVDFLTVDASQNLYRIKLVNHDRYLSLHYVSDMNVYWSGTINDYTLWQLEEVTTTNSGGQIEDNVDIIVNQKPSDCDLSSESYRTNINPFYAVGYAGQCTWFAWGRVHEKLGKSITFSQNNNRNATNWLDMATNCTVTSTPTVHSVIVWGGTGDYTNGHVAFIEKIENGKIYFSEANWDNDGFNENPATDGCVKSMTEAELDTRTTSHYIKGYLIP